MRICFFLPLNIAPEEARKIMQTIMIQAAHEANQRLINNDAEGEKRFDKLGMLAAAVRDGIKHAMGE